MEDVRRGAFTAIYWKSNREMAAEVEALRKTVRELLTNFMDPITRNLIIQNRPELRKIIEGE